MNQVIEGLVLNTSGYWILPDGKIFSLKFQSKHSQALVEIVGTLLPEVVQRFNVRIDQVLWYLEDFSEYCQKELGYLRVSTRLDEFAIELDVGKARLPKTQIDGLSNVMSLHTAFDVQVICEDRDYLGQKLIRKLREQCAS